MFWGASFIYMLYKVGDRTEPWGTPARISLGVDILPSTGTLNLRCGRKEIVSLIADQSLGIKHLSGAYDQIFITVRHLWVCWRGARSLWREDRCVVYNCCRPSPTQSFSNPRPVGLAILFYCLRFETSLFVASYDSQGYGGGIRPRLQTGY
jgi:hypothetical protein